MSNGLLRTSEPVSLALHAVAFLARHRDARLRSHEIADAIEASQTHLVKTLTALTNAGLLTSKRGANGGFALDRCPSTITLYDVYVVVAGEPSVGNCRTCHVTDNGGCLLGRLWTTLDEQMVGFLRSTTVAQLAHTTPEVLAVFA